MRSLVIVAVLCVSAASGRADVARERELAAALVKGDAATLTAAAQFPFYVYGLWFDTEPCQRFAGATYTLVSEQEFPELVACIVDLAPRMRADDDATILYGAGSPLTVRVQTDHGRARMRAFMGADPRQIEDGAAPIDREVFGPRTAKSIALPRKLTARLDKSATLVAKANLRVCFGRTGKVDAVTILDVGPDVPEFGKLSEKEVRRWKVTPFVARDQPVRACGTVLTAYPASRVTADDRLTEAAYPPPPVPPPPASVAGGSPAPQNVAPTALETQRLKGNKLVVPDAATKPEITRSGKTRVIGTFKLCVSATGAVTSVSTLKSSGFEAYDAKITREMKAWAYRPFIVNGVPTPVCTAITMIFNA